MEQDKQYYDAVYRDSKKYNAHYTESTYYHLWIEVLQWIKPRSAILDLGCGPGQFADMIKRTLGHTTKYLGVDFSGVAVSKARDLVPEFGFIWGDVFDFIKEPISDKFNLVIILEFLEHIEEDLKVIEAIPSGMEVVFSVPSYMCAGHVRCFKSTGEVIERYDALMEIYEIVHVNTGNKGNRIYLARAIKR